MTPHKRARQAAPLQCRYFHPYVCYNTFICKLDNGSDFASFLTPFHTPDARDFSRTNRFFRTAILAIRAVSSSLSTKRHDEERHFSLCRVLVRRFADRFQRRAPGSRRRDLREATRNFSTVWRLRRFAVRVLARFSSRFGHSDSARVARFERRFFGMHAFDRAAKCVRKPLVPACSHFPPRHPNARRANRRQP